MQPINQWMFNDPQGRGIWVWTTNPQGVTMWILAPGATSVTNSGGRLFFQPSQPTNVVYGGTNFGDIGPVTADGRLTIQGIPGSPAAGTWYQPQTQALGPVAQGPVAMSWQGGGTPSGNLNPAVAQLLVTQQANAASSSLTADGAAALAAAATAAAAGIALIEINTGVAMSMGATSATGSASQAQNGTMALLLSLLGVNGLSALASAIVTFNTTAEAPASQAALNTAYNTFITAVKAVLSTISNNNLIAAVASGNATANMAIVVQLLLAQTAVSTFNSSVSNSIGAALADLQAGGAAYVSGFNAFMQSMQTASLLTQALA